jgi:hypothetical protein
MEDYAVISALKDDVNGQNINDTNTLNNNLSQNKPINYIQSDINKIKSDVECMKLDIKEILRRLSDKQISKQSSTWW